MNASWEIIKQDMKAEFPKNSYALWIDPVNCIENKDDTLILGCPNKFSRKWVKEHYYNIIRDKLTKHNMGHMDLKFKVQKLKEPSSSTKNNDLVPHQLVLPNMPRNKSYGSYLFNKDFTFDHFIVGKSNEFAFSASNALANGELWNCHSLFMLANTGLGKTHLSQAVGHAIVKENPSRRVYYITAEEFTNEIITALKNNNIAAFKDKYRRCCDVLILEEIHFLSGKEKIQAELEFTLDTMENNNKKIIFTSSMAPKDIPRISSKLASRLTSGLVTTIDNPDHETRVKIIQKKARDQNIILTEDVIDLISTTLKRDIRQIESALICLKAKADLLNENINYNLARETINCFIPNETSITLEKIMDIIATYYKVEPENLRSKSRKKYITYPRNIYSYLCRRYTDETLAKIGLTINRSHSGILYGAEVVEHKMKNDVKMSNQVTFLSQRLGIK